MARCTLLQQLFLLLAWAVDPAQALNVGGPLFRTRSYDENLAARMVLYSDAAYCGDVGSGKDDTVGNWTCPPCQLANRLRAGLHSVRSIENRSHMAYGFSGLSSDNSSIVLSFRGSVVHLNVKNMHDHRLMPMPAGRGQVHTGILMHWLSQQHLVMEQVDSLLGLQPRPKRVLVTGHSLGAAISFMAGLQIAEEHPDLPVTVYGFALGGVGDLDIAQRAENTPNLLVFALTNEADTAPICGVYTAPCLTIKQGYHDVGTRIWYPGKYGNKTQAARGRDWVECKGSWLQCLNLPSEKLNWRDHDWYLGHSMYCCDLDSHDPRGPQPHDHTGKGCQPAFDFRMRTFTHAFLSGGSTQLHVNTGSGSLASEEEIRSAVAAGAAGANRGRSAAA